MSRYYALAVIHAVYFVPLDTSFLFIMLPEILLQRYFTSISIIFLF